MSDDLTATSISIGPPRWRSGFNGPVYGTTGPFPRQFGFLIRTLTDWAAFASLSGTPERLEIDTRHLGCFATETEACAAVEAETRHLVPPD